MCQTRCPVYVVSVSNKPIFYFTQTPYFGYSYKWGYSAVFCMRTSHTHLLFLCKNNKLYIRHLFLTVYLISGCTINSLAVLRRAVISQRPGPEDRMKPIVPFQPSVFYTDASKLSSELCIQKFDHQSLVCCASHSSCWCWVRRRTSRSAWSACRCYMSDASLAGSSQPSGHKKVRS